MPAAGANTEGESWYTNAPFRGSALPKTAQTLSFSSPGTETDGTLQSLSHHGDMAHFPEFIHRDRAEHWGLELHLGTSHSRAWRTL